MNSVEYKNMEERERTYWWHVGRLKIIETYLRFSIGHNLQNRILNVGCGTGGTLSTLEKYGKVDNVDVSDEAISFMKKNGHMNVTKVEGVKLPFKDNSYNIVAAFDVLEHIEDDGLALKEWYRVLAPGGSAVITVPAYQWLWSDHDESLHHKRRYTIHKLENLGENVGFEKAKISYAISFSLPLIVGFRMINKALHRKTDSETSYVNIPGSVNRLFIKMLAFESYLLKYINLPFGTSVIARLKKPQQK